MGVVSSIAMVCAVLTAEVGYADRFINCLAISGVKVAAGLFFRIF